MPVIQIDMFEGKTKEQKKAIIKEVTQAMVKAVGYKPSQITVIIRDIRPINWGTAGEQRG